MVMQTAACFACRCGGVSRGRLRHAVLKSRRKASFYAVQVPGWLLLGYLAYAQGITALGYDLGVAMGTQEPSEMITEVGAAFW